jgi:hypothetical protein
MLLILSLVFPAAPPPDPPGPAQRSNFALESCGLDPGEAGELVVVFVDALGQVVADSTRLVPPTANARFNEQVLQNAATWRFRPARENSSPVAAWFTYEVEM